MADSSFEKPSEESVASANAKQRRKRKWDQPAEALVSAGLHIPSAFPPGFVGGVAGVALPSVVLPSVELLSAVVPTASASGQQIYQIPLVNQNAASIVQKLNQETAAKAAALLPKIQDELIAREIVINDAESSTRYKLTKRQTQEEIQKCTGAVVITRGKYRPPNALPDNEKPLYLHISASAHLKETAERIKAVDHAAAMVEEILRQGHYGHPVSTSFLPMAGKNGQTAQPLSLCLFLGFDADPSLNIAARIRGPNDQYINHIMNETGVSVVLKGRGSGNLDGMTGEETQALHLHLSSDNPKSLEAAKLLAENLLDTISVECGATRISTAKGYNAVPPPQQLLAGVHTSSGNDENKTSDAIVAGYACSTAISTSVTSCSTPALYSPVVPRVSTVSTITSPSGSILGYGQVPLNNVNYRPPSFTGGTNYNGYGGIYPQATPLQQVALALINPQAQATSVQGLPPPDARTKNLGPDKSQTDKRSQRRKFQELPIDSVASTRHHEETEFLKSSGTSAGQISGGLLTIPPPKKLVPPSENGMLPCPPKSMPPPPPPKFTPPPRKPEAVQSNGTTLKERPSSDILQKLADYGDDDDNDEDVEESHKRDLGPTLSAKPFWAV